MELGALVCTPKNPRCSECPLKSRCIAYRKRIVHLLPNLPRRTPATARRFVAFVTKRNSRYLVRQRGVGVVNAHLWEFPNIEVNGETDLKNVANKALGFRPESLKPVGTIKHTITRYRITLHVFQCAANAEGKCVAERDRWLTSKHLHRLPFTSAHKRILADL
jgi:A/G-specific adenine glycosylase